MTEDYDPQSTTQLAYKDWRLSVSDLHPYRFQLVKDDTVVFSGELDIINNGHAIDMSQFLWRFRVKENQIDQWCNVQHDQALSVGISYSFQCGSLVIEYLARNSIPTRLDIRHHITQLDPSHHVSINTSEFLDNCSGWQRQHHDQPSAYLVEPGARDFRESFSATQWIVLEQNCEAPSHV